MHSAGFAVTQTSDLNSENLKSSFSGFVEKVTEASPDAIAAVYFSGYALQFGGENYLLPTDLADDVVDASDLSRRSLRLSEMTRTLSSLHPKAAFIIVDAARETPFLISGQPPASGLAWLETSPDILVAFNAAPGMIAQNSEQADRYGPYVRAIAEMMPTESSTFADTFVRVRVRVNEMTKGAQVPWHSSGIRSQFALLAPEAGAMDRSASQEIGRLRSSPMSALSKEDAYFAAVLRDTLDSYSDYLAGHWRDPLAERLSVLRAIRRETLIWRRTCRADLPEALWSYLERYPEGPHAAEARSLLQKRDAPIDPPAAFKRIEYDVPYPLPGEADYLAVPLRQGETSPPEPSFLPRLLAKSTQTFPASKDDSTPRSETLANSSRNSASIGREMTSASQVELRGSTESKIQENEALNSMGNGGREPFDRPPMAAMPYWVYPDMASAPANLDLVKLGSSRFPEWATLDPSSCAGHVLPSGGPTITGALVGADLSHTNISAGSKPNLPLASERSGSSMRETRVAAPPLVRTTQRGAASTRLLSPQAGSKRSLLSPQAGPKQSVRAVISPVR
ncbi:hypothetical protein IVB41_32575 [Bradyrhizobium sp. 44]|nr:hypothetical protein [Bradyrhizobium sp. 44]